MMSGIWIAGWGHTAQQMVTVGPKLHLHRATHERFVAKLQSVSYQPEIAREVVLDLVSSLPGALQQAQIGAIKLSPELVTALKERTTSRGFGPRKPVSSAPTVVDHLLNDPNYSDDFHKTQRLPGKHEPEPYAKRNHDWSQQPQHARTIPSLEEHIAELRKKRQQLSKEAEAIRAWFQQREATFYTEKLNAASDTEISALKPEQLYLERLGYWYLSTWMAVSEHDWMIAGATDHLAFAKAMQQGLEWPPPPAPPGKKTPDVHLEHMLLGLPMLLRGMQVQKAALPGLIAQLKQDLKEASKAGSPHCTAIEGQIRGYEQILGMWGDEIDATERVWRDAMERSEGGGDEISKKK
jgi:hypothetical protein